MSCRDVRLDPTARRGRWSRRTQRAQSAAERAASRQSHAAVSISSTTLFEKDRRWGRERRAGFAGRACFTGQDERNPLPLCRRGGAAWKIRSRWSFQRARSARALAATASASDHARLARPHQRSERTERTLLRRSLDLMGAETFHPAELARTSAGLACSRGRADGLPFDHS